MSTGSRLSTSGWSSSPCAQARKTRAPATGACRTICRRPGEKPTPDAAAADPAAKRLLLLHPVHPRLHGGLRKVTLDNALAPGEETGPQQPAPALVALPASPARWLRAVV